MWQASVENPKLVDEYISYGHALAPKEFSAWIDLRHGSDGQWMDDLLARCVHHNASLGDLYQCKRSIVMLYTVQRQSNRTIGFRGPLDVCDSGTGGNQPVVAGPILIWSAA